MFGRRWLGWKRIASSSVLCIEEKSLKPHYSLFFLKEILQHLLCGALIAIFC